MNTDFEATYPFESCGCGLCEVIHQRLREGDLRSGGWCDPRRYYLESDEEFLKRVPDGFLKFPEEHKDISRNMVFNLDASYGGELSIMENNTEQYLERIAIALEKLVIILTSANEKF